MALMVETDPEGFAHQTRDLILFHVVGIAALTLLINGTTSRWVVKWIKLIEYEYIFELF